LENKEGGSNRPLPLPRAQATVAALIHGALDQLPEKRMQDVSVGDDWATIKFDPPEAADDYAGRSDLLVASACNVELFEAMHSGSLFTSACHSKMGELFCYLKLDAGDVPKERLVAFRSELEDVLNPALIEANGGCCIGGGSGLRYAYIDLALTDLAKSIPIVRQTLAQHRAPLRSWLLFYDDDMAGEWVGAYAQTPPPPQEAPQ
jgi:hypothetical protein